MKKKKNKTNRKLPFNRRLEDRNHMMYVKTLPCMVSRAGFLSCNGPIQVHHLLKPSDGKRGMSLKSGDDQVIPLCMYHHQELHTKFGDEFAFFKHYGFKQDYGQKYAKDLYERTLHYEDNDDDDLPF